VNLILKIPGLLEKKPLTPAPVGAEPGTLVVDPEAPTPRVQIIAYGPEELVETVIDDVEHIADYLGRYPVSWVNVDGLGDPEIVQRLGQIFGIHELAQEDILNVRHRPKLEEFDDHLFIMTRMAGGGEPFQYEQMSLLLGSNYVLSLQQRPGDCLDPVRERLRHKRGTFRSYGADYLAYSILDAVVDGYFPVLEDYGERLEELEEEILERPRQATILKVQSAKRDMLALRRSIWPQREFFGALVRDPTPLLTDRTRTYLRDTHDHAIRIMDLVDTYRDISSGLTDLYMSSVSNRMNDVMKVLTVIATIFIPLTFIAGIYGMNFNPEVSPFNMPELNWYWAYPACWVVMITIAALLLMFFRRKGWIGSGDSSD
jgi:magnesium transporter